MFFKKKTTTFFLNPQPDFKGRKNTNQCTNKTKSSCISPVRILVNLCVWQHPEQDSLPICLKTTYSANTALKRLSDQCTSVVDDCVDNNFSLNQHHNKIFGKKRLWSVLYKRRPGKYKSRSGKYHNAAVFLNKMSLFLSLKGVCLKSFFSFFFVEFTVSEVFQVHLN